MGDDFKLGDVIADKYRLERPLGEGAFGAVWKAVQINVKRPVAIKFLKNSFEEDSAHRRFEREAKALARLDHPNCVVLYDFGHHGEQAFLVTEYLEGETLHDWKNRDQELLAILDVTYQLLDALAHAHALNVVHRDLKPGNVILVRDVADALRVKVLDFGISSIAGEKRGDITKTGELFGTPGFMSPEQLSGDENIGPPADLYALGVIMFHMLEGAPPFRAKTQIEAVLKHITDEPPPLEREGLPDDVEAFVHRLLEKDPDDRYQTARAAQQVLRGLDIGRSVELPISPPEPVQAAPPGPQSPRERTPFAGVKAAPRQDEQEPHTAPARPRALQAARATPKPAPTTSPEPPREGRRPPAWALAAGAVGLIAVVAGAFALAGDDDAPEHADDARIVSALSTRPSDHDDPPPAVERERPADPPKLRGSPVQVGASSGCGSAFGETGLQTVSVLEGIDTTETTVFVPSSYDPDRPHPVAILLHDTLQSPEMLLKQTGFRQMAERDGVVLVLPEHNVMLSAWGTKRDHARARREFEAAASELCLAMDRIYLYGHGGGGFAAEELACAIDGVQAVAVSAHRLGEGQSPCSHPDVSYLLLSPLHDGRDPVDGGEGCITGAKISLDAHEKAYRRIHKCQNDRRTVFEHRYGRCFEWTCETPFVSCHIDGGRPLPGGTPNIACEGEAVDFPYGERIWEFFSIEPAPADTDDVEP